LRPSVFCRLLPRRVIHLRAARTATAQGARNIQYFDDLLFRLYDVLKNSPREGI
jgi:hypothetical protein